MMIPVRCFTCGSVIADKYDEYRKRVDEGENPAEILDKLGVKRYCCRRMFLSQVDVIDEIIKHGKF
ncbi:MAG: DNA-directed RNA polymerase subunit N [Candidatus Micrarchaeota archaeon]